MRAKAAVAECGCEDIGARAARTPAPQPGLDTQIGVTVAGYGWRNHGFRRVDLGAKTHDVAFPVITKTGIARALGASIAYLVCVVFQPKDAAFALQLAGIINR